MISSGQSVSMPCDADSRSASKSLPEILGDGRLFLEDFRTFLLETAALFRTGQETQAKESFVQVVEALQCMMYLINEIAPLMRKRLAEAAPAAGSLDGSLGDLNMVLAEMMSSQERRDWVLLADLMEYELAPHLKIWDENCAMLSAGI